jgi:CRISPR system Cascade subunit CasD
LLPTYGGAAFGTKKGVTTGTVLSTRFYLADASFLVGLEASTPDQETLLTRVNDALARPVWPLFLGRKAFVPATPIRLRDGLRPEPLEEALRTFPWLTTRDGEQRWREPARVRLVIEERQPTGESRMDVPVSFLPLDRRYQSRFVRTEFLSRPAEVAGSTSHTQQTQE